MLEGHDSRNEHTQLPVVNTAVNSGDKATLTALPDEEPPVLNYGQWLLRNALHPHAPTRIMAATIHSCTAQGSHTTAPASYLLESTFK